MIQLIIAFVGSFALYSALPLPGKESLTTLYKEKLEGDSVGGLILLNKIYLALTTLVSYMAVSHFLG